MRGSAGTAWARRALRRLAHAVPADPRTAHRRRARREDPRERRAKLLVPDLPAQRGARHPHAAGQAALRQGGLARERGGRRGRLRHARGQAAHVQAAPPGVQDQPGPRAAHLPGHRPAALGQRARARRPGAGRLRQVAQAAARRREDADQPGDRRRAALCAGGEAGGCVVFGVLKNVELVCRC